MMPAHPGRGLLVAALLACALPALALATGGPQATGSRPVAFAGIYGAATRAANAYRTPEVILGAYGPDTIVRHLPRNDILYFVTFDPDLRMQIVSIRGTATLKDVLVDTELVRVSDKLTGVRVHRGFRDATDDVFHDVLPRLRPGYTTRIIGHSLGGAVATILMMHFMAEGIEIQEVVTFGQPKVTDQAGAAHYEDAPVRRVVDMNDMVHFLPPDSLFGREHYVHIGPEVELLDGKDYQFHPQTRDSTAAESFWHNLLHESLAAHHIANYLERLRPKAAGALEVSAR